MDGSDRPVSDEYDDEYPDEEFDDKKPTKKKPISTIGDFPFVDKDGIPFEPILNWKTIEGRLIPISEIKDDHLANIIRYLERAGKIHGNAYKTMVWQQKLRAKERLASRDAVKSRPEIKTEPGEEFSIKITDPTDPTDPIKSTYIKPVDFNDVIEFSTKETVEKTVDVSNAIFYILVGKSSESSKIKDMLSSDEYTFEEVSEKASEIGVEIEIPINGALANSLSILKEKSNARDEIRAKFNEIVDEFGDDFDDVKERIDSIIKSSARVDIVISKIRAMLDFVNFVKKSFSKKVE